MLAQRQHRVIGGAGMWGAGGGGDILKGSCKIGVLWFRI